MEEGGSRTDDDRVIKLRDEGLIPRSAAGSNVSLDCADFDDMQSFW